MGCANQLNKQISSVHQMMRDDGQRPSRYEPAYNTLMDQYRDSIAGLRELDPENVSQFREKVKARINGLKARMDDLCNDWDPAYFGYFERMLVCYEKNSDLLAAL